MRRLGFGTLLFASSFVLVTARAVHAQRDNVLVIVADDLGVDAVGAYGLGAAPPPTPNIDALAAQGVLFRNAITNPVCSPTRACLMTGRYSFRTGVGRQIPTLEGLPPQNVLPLDEITVPELLDAKRSGYAHAYIGKWHLGDGTNGGPLGPNLAGWSHFAGLLRGWTPDYYRWERVVNGAAATSTAYATTQIADDALAWMESAPEPWLCWVSFNAPHDPYHAPPPALHTQNLAGLSPRATPVPFFKAMVEAMDTEIGRLLGTIDPAVRARTTVIFLGDNGTDGVVSEPPFLAAHAKGTPYEGGVRVPLVVTGPIVQGAPRTEDALVSAVDVFATVAELCGVDAQLPFRRIDSLSFVPHLAAAGAPPVRSAALVELFDASNFLGSGFAALRDQRYKLIRFLGPGTATEEMYDLQLDPFEQSDLLLGALSAQEQWAYQQLAAQLTALRDTSGSFAVYGSAACAGGLGLPAISATGTPRLGDTYTVHLQNGGAAQLAFLLLGGSRTTWEGIPLPFPLAAIGGGPGCFIEAAGDLVAPVLTTAGGDASCSVPLPVEPTLVSAPVYHAWIAVDPAAPGNPLGITTSPGLVAVVGS